MAPPLFLRGGHAVIDGDLARADILVEGNRITAVGESPAPAGAQIVDIGGMVAGPGFVDVHVHGGGGASFFTRDASRLSAYSAWAPAQGVTSYLVSTAGRHPADLVRTLEGLAPAIGRAPGAESLGFHLEGPFLNPVRRGAFAAETLQAPDATVLRRFFEAAEGHVRQLTLAPELDGGGPLAAACCDAGIVPAMGHSDATFEQASVAVEAGVAHVTHLFNAMRPIHQRDGGIAVAALVEGRVTCELICDLVHVAPEMLRLAYACLGPSRMVVVTDNLHLAGTNDVSAPFLAGDVNVSGEAAARPDGTLVGSVLPMIGHFRNVVNVLNCGLAAAFRMCATNPALVAGVSHRKGQLLPGYDADIVVLDADSEVVLTIARGAVAYARDASVAAMNDSSSE